MVMTTLVVGRPGLAEVLDDDLLDLGVGQLAGGRLAGGLAGGVGHQLLDLDEAADFPDAEQQSQDERQQHWRTRRPPRRGALSFGGWRGSWVVHPVGVANDLGTIAHLGRGRTGPETRRRMEARGRGAPPFRRNYRSRIRRGEIIPTGAGVWRLPRGVFRRRAKTARRVCPGLNRELLLLTIPGRPRSPRPFPDLFRNRHVRTTPDRAVARPPQLRAAAAAEFVHVAKTYTHPLFRGLEGGGAARRDLAHRAGRGVRPARAEPGRQDDARQGAAVAVPADGRRRRRGSGRPSPTAPRWRRSATSTRTTPSRATSRPPAFWSITVRLLFFRRKWCGSGRRSC